MESDECRGGKGGDCLNHGLRGLHGLVLGTGWREDILWRGGSISVRRIGRRNAASSGDGARMGEPIPVGGIATWRRFLWDLYQDLLSPSLSTQLIGHYSFL